jgi:hypothetical protein
VNLLLCGCRTITTIVDLIPQNVLLMLLSVSVQAERLIYILISN